MTTPTRLAGLVDQAALAQPEVERIPLDRRLAMLADARDALAGDARLVVDEAVRETGRTIRFARRELDSALMLLDAMPALAEAIRPVAVPAVSGSTTLEWAPYGVVFGWHAANSPIWVPTVVVASALIGGNAVISRPSRRTRVTSRLVVEAVAAVWPQHAVQVCDAPPEEAETLVAHPGVGAVVTHGSTATCKRQMALITSAYADGVPMRPYIPEASGNDPAIVLAGADLAAAARAVAVGAFTNAGQLCMAAKRIIVESRIWNEFRPLLRAEVEGLLVGDPSREDTDVAPLSGGRGLGRARTAMAEALTLGGEIVAGRGEQGPFFTPTVVLLPRSAASTILWSEESFAPLRGLMLAADAEDALALANADVHGLGASVFGDGESIVSRLRAGRVVMNDNPLYQDPHFVVGGVGESGLFGARPKVEQLVYARRVHRAARPEAGH